MARPHRFDKTFSKNERAKRRVESKNEIRTEVARKIAKGLTKRGENGTEHCHKVERVKQLNQIPNNVVNLGDKELGKGGEIPEKLT